MRKKIKPIPEIGRRFGRTDLERCDLFMDMGFPEWGVNNLRPKKIDKASQKPQISSGIPAGGHKKCGIQKQSGYFAKEFISIFVNDRFVDKWKLLAKELGKPRRGPWIPAHATELSSTPGDYYGTFIRRMEHFSPLLKQEFMKKRPELKNFLTNPSKKGNAGYADICINKYPPHTFNDIVDSYPPGKDIYAENWRRHKEKIRNGPFKPSCYPRYFDENPFKAISSGPEYVRPVEHTYGKKGAIFYPPATPKMPGNNHDGCFSKFPAWEPDPYMTVKDAEKILHSKYRQSSKDSIWKPEPRLKSYYTVSVVNNKIDTACNERTWRGIRPISYPQFNV